MHKAIAQFIETKTGLTLGDDLIFGHRTPDSPKDCVLIAFNGGGAAYFDLPDRADVMVQVLSRAESYADALEASMLIYEALHGLAYETLPTVVSGESWEAMSIEAVNAPQYIGPDEKGRHEWSTNYIFRIKDAMK